MEEQVVGSEDVGTVEVVLEAEVEKEETKLEAVQRLKKHIVNSKAWALAKADTIENGIKKAGGDVPAVLQEALAELRTSCE